jgi:glycine/D-amino acid oxidase-like deaminating enzyme
VLSDLFWMGRYAERAENTARLLTVTRERYHEYRYRQDMAGSQCVPVLLAAIGWFLIRTTDRIEDTQREQGADIAQVKSDVRDLNTRLDAQVIRQVETNTKRLDTLDERVQRIEREGGAWRALDADERVLAEAPLLVLANAADAARLLPEARLRLSRVRGQLTYLPPSPARRLEIVVSGTGYVAPLFEGGHAVGATYHHDDDDASIRAADHAANLARAESMLPGFTAGLEPERLAGWTGFRATVPDRLPIAGAAAHDGLYTLTGLGSRGLLWGPIASEILASGVEDEPLPLSRDHAGAISPRRFLS